VRSPVPDYLADVLHDCADGPAGRNTDYLPELAQADPERFALSLCTVNGAVHGAGDVQQEFSIQSISKPFVYAMALADRGLEAVLDKIDVEPSGEAFNEISLEEGSARPLNPMINAGALTAHTLVGEPGMTAQERTQRILTGLSAFAGRNLAVDQVLYESEKGKGHRNLAIAHMLRSHDIITEEAPPVVYGYHRQCSVLVTSADLAVMAATLANGGLQPVTGEQVVPQPVIRQVLSVMATCGMYDAAGDWLSTVGIPAKSGISGGIIGALPGQIGIGVFSPPLDEHGTSVRGVRVCERLSDDLSLHLMEVSAPARAVMRSTHATEGPERDRVRVYELQGTIQFAGAEGVVHAIVENPPDTEYVSLDLSRVDSVNGPARRLLGEMLRRLEEDGHRVSVVDPESVFDPGSVLGG
jgi:glutaminase